MKQVYVKLGHGLKHLTINGDGGGYLINIKTTTIQEVAYTSIIARAVRCGDLIITEKPVVVQNETETEHITNQIEETD